MKLLLLLRSEYVSVKQKRRLDTERKRKVPVVFG